MTNISRKKGPVVSIIMPCYNSAVFLDETFESLLDQVDKRFEIIAVNDASVDNTLSRLEYWQNHFIHFKIVNLINNKGPGAARNAGIAVANCNLIALIDSDDVWDPYKLSVQISRHQLKGCQISCTSYKVGDYTVSSHDCSYTALLKNNFINTSSVMYNRSKLTLCFQSKYHSEDYVEWLRVLKKTRLCYIDIPLVERRVRRGLSKNKITMARRRWSIYRDIEGLNFFNAGYYFCHYAFTGIRKYLKM